MQYVIAQDVLKRTDRCGHGFSCLSCSKDCLCPVVSAVDGAVVFVDEKCTRKPYCGYRMGFGNGHICTCPTRKALFHQYRV